MSDQAPELARRFMLALAVYREARGESLVGKLLVAQVIRNRVEDPRWPNTYTGVITQRLQFSAFNAGDPNVTVFPAEADPVWAQCVAAADVVLQSPQKLTLANHYHVRGLSPAWRDDSKIVATAGAHVFYRL